MGLWLTLKYASRGYQVLCLRLDDGGSPCCETLRNQGWLQSGARYYRIGITSGNDQLVADSYRMHKSGEITRLQVAGVVGPASMGILRMREDDDWPEHVLGGFVSDKVSVPAFSMHPLPLEAVRARCAERLCPSDGRYMSTAEIPFEEDQLMEDLRRKIRAPGRPARLRVLSTPAHLFRLDQEPARVLCRVTDGGQDWIIDPQRLVIAAGAGTPALLEDLDCPLGLTVKKTPLLVGPIDDQMGSTVLEERVRRLTLASHVAAGKVIAVAGVGVEDMKLVDKELSRQQLAAEQVYGAPSRCICESVAAVVDTRVTGVFTGPYRVTAGYEPFVNGQADWLPLLRAISPGSNAVVALPGRATLAAAVADECHESEFEGGGWQVAPQPLRPPTPLGPWPQLPGTDWTDAIHMHYHTPYDSLNDVESKP